MHYIIHTYTIKHFAGTIETKKKPEREQATSSSGKRKKQICQDKANTTNKKTKKG